MFIWDFVADTVLGQILDWIYSQMIGFLGNFFAAMGNMGADLFDMTWVKSIVLFFTYLGWALYGTGLVVSAFECGIEYQSGRGSIKDTALNNIKGFLAVGLFSTVPVELYKLSVSQQSSFTARITRLGTGIDTVAGNIISQLSSAGALEQAANAGVFGGIGSTLNPIMLIFILIMMGYAVIKVFFANLKRGAHSNRGVALLMRQCDEDRDKFTAAVTHGDHVGSLQNIINLTHNFDCYWLYPTVHNSEDYGYYLIEMLDELELPKVAKKYLDYKTYGHNAVLEDGGSFTDQGYIYNNKNTFSEWYKAHDMPEEYRVTPQQPTRPDPEKVDMDAIGTRQAAVLTAQPPQPVNPLVLTGQNNAERMKEITDKLEAGIQAVFEGEQ